MRRDQREYCKKWAELNKEKRKQYHATRYQQQKDKILQRKRLRKDEINERDKFRYANDIQYRLKVVLRKRLWHALKKNQKTGSAVEDLGCTIEEFKIYLESKFQSGMSWTNMGKWHIDHIKPLDAFDLTDLVQLRQACHFTNLQPMWAVDNLKKGIS